MAEAQSSTTIGLTRGKAILIGVLAIVLVAVLYVQFGGQVETESSKPATRRPPRQAMAVQPTAGSVKPAPVAVAAAKKLTPPVAKAVAGLALDEQLWRSPQLKTIVAYDPFALPAAFPQPLEMRASAADKDSDALLAADAAEKAKKVAEVEEQRRLVLEELRQCGVNVISNEGDQYVVMIGERILRIGDTIDEFTVTAIDPDDPKETVHIERKESP